MWRIILVSLLLLLPLRAAAGGTDDILSADLRPGWRMSNGDHMAALQLTLAPGWKTYWRAPGDAGIPPVFDWTGSRNVKSVSVHWPSPHVFHQSGMRSLGYKGGVTLPLRVTPVDPRRDIALRLEVDLGVCHDVCVPKALRTNAELDAGATRADPAIAAALATLPLSAAEAGIGAVRCAVSPAQGGIALSARIPMPRPAGAVEAVVETADPEVWASQPVASWEGGHLVVQSRLKQPGGGAFALDRSGLRFTLLSDGRAVDIRGCKG